ncbi:MAG: hypothetical protein JXR46_08335 [Calditrichaceae bacterium]|nr:hypothetical protein [Calditrichaceae bacterium]MBN2709038.1 hypothetical protein [Calditrichaceae bacterium]RQV96997.1 MAG: hypothetical protein EH224_02560 [Calditrichota bacterium]
MIPFAFKKLQTIPIDLNRLIKITVLVVLILFYGISNAENNLKNVELAEKMLTEIIDSLITVHVTGNTDLGVRTAEGGYGELQFLESAFLQRCYEKKVAVRIDSPAVLFFFERVNFLVDYTPTKEHLFGYDNALKRNISVTINGWIEDFRADLKAPLKINRHISDIIDGDRINALEKDGYDFLTGRRHSGGIWSAIVEPVIIIGSVSVIIYLFFTQRS